MEHFLYENLSDEEFENLVIRISKEILGIGCKTFSLGKDGARDSWFTGTAYHFPSKTAPWSGTFNLQAKHTKIFNASCSDNDFHVNQTSVLSKEIVRLKEVVQSTPFNNYIIFTNRKLPGGIHPVIVKKLQDGIGIQNVEIIGREQIDSYLEDFPNVAYQFGLHKFQQPLRFYEKDLRDIIVFFADNQSKFSVATQNYATSFSAISKEEKNELNNLSTEYFNFIKKHSLQYFTEIENFLKDPKNEKYLEMYSNTISDLQNIITIQRNRFSEFEHIINHLVDYLVENNEEKLRSLRRIARVFVHFMYFNCDIGKTS